MSGNERENKQVFSCWRNMDRVAAEVTVSYRLQTNQDGDCHRPIPALIVPKILIKSIMV